MYIDDARVLLSPSSVGAGPVVLIVTNQASRAESLTVAPAGGGSPLARTGVITPQATAQVQVDLASPGVYSVVAGSGAGVPDTTTSASLYVGRKRPSASGALLQP